MLDRIELHAALAKERAEARVDRVEARLGERAPRDRRLVREDDQAETERRQLLERVEGARQELQLVGVQDVADLAVDRAIAIQQDEAPAHAGLHVRSPERASTPAARNEKSASWPPRDSSAAATAERRDGSHARSR